MANIPSNRKTTTAKNYYDVLPDDVYLARFVRFVGLGVQDQPEFKGEKKDPAFKCSLQFELLGVDATGKDAEGKPLEARPACQFADMYLFPGAKRGKVYDFVKLLEPGLEKVPGDIQWFIDKLGSVINLEVGHYIAKDGGKKNKVLSMSAASRRDRENAEDARSELVGFDPYEDNDTMFDAYSKIFKFQREMLAEAHDKQHIPFAGKEPAKQDSPKSEAKPSETQGTDTPDGDDKPW